MVSQAFLKKTQHCKDVLFFQIAIAVLKKRMNIFGKKTGF